MDNYGLIIQHLRRLAGLSLRQAADKIGKSVGWLSEIENGKGRSRLSEREFERVVALLDGSKHRAMFRTWVANYKNADRIDRTLDGAVLKFIRLRKQLRLREAAEKLGLSICYLSRLEGGSRPITAAMRTRIMESYGYNPSSFKNLSTDPVRSKTVPGLFKLEILLRRLPKYQTERVLEFIQSLLKDQPAAV